MQRDDIIRMALESGFGCDTDGHIFTYNQDGICDEYLERFADLVAAVEREACAKFLERGVDMAGLAGDPVMQKYTAELLLGCAAAIRARGDK